MTENSETDSPQEARQRAAHLGPAKRRPMVLDAARDVFAEYGYERTSIGAIAEKIGVSKPVVYECYPNKLALFDALLDREEERIVEYMSKAIPKAPQEGEDSEEIFAEETLIRGFTAVLESVQKWPRSWEVLYLTEHGTEPAVSNRIDRGRFVQTRGTIAIAVARLMNAGYEDSDNRKAVVYGNMMIGICDSLIRLMIKQPDMWTPQELGAWTAKLFKAGEVTFKD